ncbi:hypothetical protein P8452_17537 [Trifolium repens]|nr:hypothetical protein P8452_17537 [Trifolium repens]
MGSLHFELFAYWRGSAPPSSLCFFLFLSKTTIITHNQPTHCATIFHLLTSLPHFSFQTQTHRKKTKRIRRVHWTRQKKSTREEEEVEELHSDLTHAGHILMSCG